MNKDSAKKPGWNDFVNTSEKSEPVVNQATSQPQGNKFIERLGKIMEEANLPGPDYREFVGALQNMDDMGFTLEQKFKSAFASFKTQGLTKESLVSTAKHYIQLLNDEKRKFEDASRKNLESKVNAPKGDIAGLEQLNGDLAEQIKNLQSQIDANNAKIEQIKRTAQSASAQVEATRTEFMSAHKLFVEKIESDINNIDKILGGK